MIDPHADKNEDLSGRWVGNFFGTHPGPVFLEIRANELNETQITISLKLHENIKIIESENEIAFNSPITVKYFKATDPDQKMDGALEVELFTQDEIRGTWQGQMHSGGVFRFAKVAWSLPENQSTNNPLNEELVEIETIIGPIAIYKNEISGLVSDIRSCFSTPQVLVICRASIGKKERISRQFNNFIDMPGLPSVLTNLQLEATDTSTPLHRSVVVQFEEGGVTKIFARSGDKLWTHGAKETLRCSVSEYSNNFSNFIQKYRFDINICIIIFSVMFWPEMNFTGRFILTVAVFSLLLMVKYLSERVIEHKIFTDDTKRTFIQTNKRSFAVALSAVAVTALVPILAGLMTDDRISSVRDFFKRLLLD